MLDSGLLLKACSSSRLQPGEKGIEASSYREPKFSYILVIPPNKKDFDPRDKSGT